MEEQSVFDYIKTQENRFKTERVPLTSSKDWNMLEHIERCTNVANAWYHTGKNDGLRPYDDIVTPIINVAFRTEGFDAKDIIPFVDDADKAYMSFIIKKYAPQWNRKHELDTFIDDVVESSIIYDLVLVKNVYNIVPEVVDLRTIAFCDQTDIMKGPICLKHYFSVSDLNKMKGKWIPEKIDEAIVFSEESKKVKLSNDQEAKTPAKNIEVYELRGDLPEAWITEGSEMYSYVPQMQVVCFYTDKDGKKQGITLYKGKDKTLSKNFKALKIDRIRSKGRACGRSIVESLFEPQVWNNYSAIKIKALLDSSISIFQTDSDEWGDKKMSEIKNNTVLKHETGKPITKVQSDLSNITHFGNYQVKQENSARVIGSASDAQLGTNPVSGTPFSLQELVVQQGQGIHEYRRGKIATFFADELYRDWILQFMISDLNKGNKFSEELSLDELIEVAKKISNNLAEKKIKEMVINGEMVDEASVATLKETLFTQAKEKYSGRAFFEVIQGELSEIPVNVMVNVAGKQKDMARDADKITNIIREVLKNPQAFSQVPGIGKAFNELLETSGMSPIDFTEITQAQPTPQQPQGVAPQ